MSDTSNYTRRRFLRCGGVEAPIGLFHPIHFHGHSFRVITRNGQPTSYKEWQDIVLIAPVENVEIAFVADNPGDWMFHCRFLEHQAAGMVGVIRVAIEED